MEAGVKLGLGSAALATACSSFHALAAAAPGLARERLLAAAAALFVAAKAQGTPRRARDVLNVTLRCLQPGSPPPALDGNFWALRDSLVQCELLLLRALRFRLPLAHPHKVRPPPNPPGAPQKIPKFRDPKNPKKPPNSNSNPQKNPNSGASGCPWRTPTR
ncbi:cyclin-Q [Lonchura striata]